jgi:hypothetical protein
MISNQNKAIILHNLHTAALMTLDDTTTDYTQVLQSASSGYALSLSLSPHDDTQHNYDLIQSRLQKNNTQDTNQQQDTPPSSEPSSENTSWSDQEPSQTWWTGDTSKNTTQNWSDQTTTWAESNTAWSWNTQDEDENQDGKSTDTAAPQNNQQAWWQRSSPSWSDTQPWSDHSALDPAALEQIQRYQEQLSQSSAQQYFNKQDQSSTNPLWDSLADSFFQQFFGQDFIQDPNQSNQRDW